MDLCNINHIKALLARHKFHFSKSLGQNFLIDPQIPQDIAAAAGLGATVGVLEIGPGIGCLTVELAKLANKVATVEFDKNLYPILGETLKDYDNISLIRGDILEADLDALVNEHFSGLKPVVAANLPYHITTPILSKLIDSKLFAQITVMVQREVALRMCAAPGTSDYGAFSLYINYHTKAEILFDIPPGSFVPAPKVFSSVICLTKRDVPPVNTQPEKLFALIKAAFSQRRKTLVNCIMSTSPHIPKDQLVAGLKSLGLDPRIRGEVLSLEQFSALADLLIAQGFF